MKKLLNPFYFLSFNQFFSGAAAGIISTGEIIQDVPVDKPGIVDFTGREVSLAAEPFYRFRVDPETAAGLDYGKIVIPDRHYIQLIPL
jgi:hypothetical protein